jgi:hypothetical protein
MSLIRFTEVSQSIYCTFSESSFGWDIVLEQISIDYAMDCLILKFTKVCTWPFIKNEFSCNAASWHYIFVHITFKEFFVAIFYNLKIRLMKLFRLVLIHNDPLRLPMRWLLILVICKQKHELVVVCLVSLIHYFVLTNDGMLRDLNTRLLFFLLTQHATSTILVLLLVFTNHSEICL